VEFGSTGHHASPVVGGQTAVNEALDSDDDGDSARAPRALWGMFVGWFLD